jgi:DNA-binding CsgD family transcriptional regulator
MTHVEAFLHWRTDSGSDPLPVMLRTAARLRTMGCVVGAALVFTDVAEVAEHRRDREAVDEAAGALTAIAADLDRDFYRGIAGTARALSALVSGDGAAAVAAAAEAEAALSGLDCRVHHARAMDVFGRALSATEPGRAVGVLRQAAETFASCGAGWRHARTLDQLTRLGRAGRRAGWAVQGPSALTRREREVARLAAAGSSARDIARRLHIGERTVETHLSRVYAKLGVESKPQLAARAAEFAL